MRTNAIDGIRPDLRTVESQLYIDCYSFAFDPISSISNWEISSSAQM